MQDNITIATTEEPADIDRIARIFLAWVDEQEEA